MNGQQHDPYGDHFGPGDEIQAPAPTWGVTCGRGADAPAPRPGERDEV